jgi:Phage protein Gp138 N-terminal domain
LDPRERTGSLQVALNAALDGRQAQIWTSMPAIVESVDFTKMTASAQPTIQGQFRNQQGVWQNVTMPLCVDCPIVFPGGGDFLMTFPLTRGDEVLINFTARCLDGWWQSGGVSPQAQLRMHDLSDGCISPKLYSLATVPAGLSTTNPQIRNKAGTLMIELDPATNRCNILATGGLWLNGAAIT